MNIVQGIQLRSTDFLRRTIAPAGGQGAVTMSYLCPNCNSCLLEDYMWWVSAGKKHCSWWCAIYGEKSDCRAPNRFLVVQTGASARNLINALKLSANQQKDGDSPIQSIVTGLCERSRKGIMEGLRNFIEVDVHCALEVGHLKEGTWSLKVRRPKFEEGVPRGVNQGRSRGIDAQNRRSWLQIKRASMLVTSRRTGGDRPWWTLIGMPLAKRSS